MVEQCQTFERECVFLWANMRPNRYVGNHESVHQKASFSHHSTSRSGVMTAIRTWIHYTIKRKQESFSALLSIFPFLSLTFSWRCIKRGTDWVNRWKHSPTQRTHKQRQDSWFFSADVCIKRQLPGTWAAALPSLGNSYGFIFHYTTDPPRRSIFLGQMRTKCNPSSCFTLALRWYSFHSPVLAEIQPRDSIINKWSLSHSSNYIFWGLKLFPLTLYFMHVNRIWVADLEQEN